MPTLLLELVWCVNGLLPREQDRRQMGVRVGEKEVLMRRQLGI